jgi:hypothetical protein
MTTGMIEGTAELYSEEKENGRIAGGEHLENSGALDNLRAYDWPSLLIMSSILLRDRRFPGPVFYGDL